MRENALRDREGHDPTYDDVYIDHITPEGKRVDVKVPKVRAHLHIFGVRSDCRPYAGIFGSHGQAEPRLPLCPLIRFEFSLRYCDFWNCLSEIGFYLWSGQETH